MKRYISKYTVNPAIAQGMGIVGSLEVGKLADLVFWSPSNFGVKPKLIVKSGFCSHKQMVSYRTMRFAEMLLMLSRVTLTHPFLL